MTAVVSLDRSEAIELCEAAFLTNRVAPETARLVAEALVQAEIDGQSGHGLARVSSYAAQARSGKVDGFATPTAARPKPAMIEVDAKHGFAYPALELAKTDLAAAAHETGIAAAAIRNSHHCGVLGHHVEALAEQGLTALMVANTPKAMAPAGGSLPLFGTNPIAFATPAEGRAPIVIDVALSNVARGKVMAASKKGEAIPLGWALDENGDPTTDPQAALKGSMLPIGDAKGAALALIVEVLAGALAGPHLSFEATDFFSADGAPPALGQFLIAIETSRSATDGVGRLLQAIAAQEGTRPPGDRRLAAREKAREGRFDAPAALVDEIRALAAG